MDDQFFVKCCELEARLELSNQRAWLAEQRVLQLEAQVAELSRKLDEQTKGSVSHITAPGTASETGQ